MLRQIHQQIFGHPPTNKTTAFMKGLSWSVVGIFITSPIMMVVSISLGRFLGPEGYGYYSIVLTIANILAVLANFSFDQAAIKLGSKEPTSKQGSSYFTTSFYATLFISFVLGIVLLVSARFFSHILGGLPLSVFLFAFVYSLVLAIRQTSDSYIRTLGLFKYQATVKIIETSLLSLLFMIIFVFLKQRSFENYLIILISSLAVTVTIYFAKLRPYLNFGWSKKSFQTAWVYARIGGTVSILGFVAQNLDRFFINAHLGTAELGLYSAYMLIPTNLAGVIATSISNVFFPAMSASADKRPILDRVNFLFRYAGLPILTAFAGLGFITLFLFGSSYNISFLNLLLASSYGMLLVYLALASAIVTSSTVMFGAYLKRLPIKLAVIVLAYTVLSKSVGLTTTLVLVVAIINLLLDALFLNRSLGATKSLNSSEACSTGSKSGKRV